MKIESALVMTHKRHGKPRLPHLDALKQSNPAVEIHVIDVPDTHRGPRWHWKNSDVGLRDWWKANRDQVQGDALAVLEWDTLAEIPLPDLPPGADLAGALVMREDVKKRASRRRLMMKAPDWTPDDWFWWPEARQLGIGDAPAWGLVSFGFMLCRRWILDALAAPKWDRAFRRNVQNELRFPTLAAMEGATIVQMDLQGVNHHETTPGPEPGIFHSVKAPRALSALPAGRLSDK